AAEVHEEVEIEGRVVAQVLADALPALGGDQRGVVSEIAVCLQNRRAELRLELLEDDLAHVVPRPRSCSAFSALARASFSPMVSWSSPRRSFTRLGTGSVRGFTMAGRRSPRAILSWRSISPSSTASGR